jgi:hypothetical protein
MTSTSCNNRLRTSENRIRSGIVQGCQTALLMLAALPLTVSAVSANSVDNFAGFESPIAAARNADSRLEVFGANIGGNNLGNNAGQVFPKAETIPGGQVNFPGLNPLEPTQSSVTVRWYDRSNNEEGFRIYRRNIQGNWQLVNDTPTKNMADDKGDYSWVDTDQSMSGQCYVVTAYNSTNSGSSGEECTVRPDPSRFPQQVAGAAPQWIGLSNSNDGTGPLQNFQFAGFQLKYGHQTLGVDLTWEEGTSLWKVEAQGGPHLMKGQAVALRVWGGGWVKYGNQTWGVDLQLSDTPSYEWYAIGIHGDPSEDPFAGHNLEDAGGFALWNRAAQAYLVHGHQTWGVDLKWYKPNGGTPPTPIPTKGVRTYRMFNCSIEQRSVEVWIADQTAGTEFVDKGTVSQQYGAGGSCVAPGSVPFTFSPISSHHYRVVATDRLLPACGGIDDPHTGPCQKMTVDFNGDATGFTRTDTIDAATQITP